MDKLTEAWQRPLTLAVCPNCDARFLHGQSAEPRCARCFRADLQPDATHHADIGDPATIVPFSADEQTLRAACDQFVRGVWFRPQDFTTDNLMHRLQQVYLPTWQVSSRLVGQWQAELGFDYRVISHVEQYSGGSWRTAEVKKTRVDWEPRFATLDLRYDELETHALNAIPAVTNQLGPLNGAKATPYDASIMDDALVYAPDRGQDAAWPDLLAEIGRRCQRDSVMAGSAEHVRNFDWNVQCPDQQWRHQLLPVYKTYYADEDGHIIPLTLHGNSGKLIGVQRGSPKKARSIAVRAGIVVAVAVLTMLLAYLLLVEPLFFVAAFVAAVAAIVAIFPLAYVWSLNRQAPDPERTIV